MMSMEDSLSVIVQSMDLLNDGRVTSEESPVLPHHSVRTMLWTSVQLPEALEAGAVPPLQFFGLECSPCALGIQGLRCQSLVEGHAGPANRASGAGGGAKAHQT